MVKHRRYILHDQDMIKMMLPTRCASLIPSPRPCLKQLSVVQKKHSILGDEPVSVLYNVLCIVVYCAVNEVHVVPQIFFKIL